MRLAIVNLTGGGMSGGYRKYLKEVLPRLVASSAVTRVDMLSPADTVPPELSRPATTHGEWARGDRWRGFREARRLLLALRPDIVYLPTARWISSNGLPTVVMVQNMEPLINPGYANPWFERAVNVARRKATKRACTNATRIIAISAFVRDFLTTSWEISPERVGTVYHGVVSAGARAVPVRPGVLGREEANGGPFLFVAGSVRPMRGIEDGVLALARLKNSLPGLRLVVAGALEGRVGQWSAGLRALVSEHGLDSRVVWAGKLSEGEMTWCYENCAAFLMTSRVEACPNIALEAMNSGSVTISTRNPPMPEFFVDSALYYDAGNPDQLALQIERVLAMPARERSGLAESGRERAHWFNWEECARRTVEELGAAAR
ncbi:MAG TPA: glycosyltransferase family 1 protein [Gemmatimonadaceae bacterium]|nr:glycosyltransferase family 1 protein [Gemmatimonadaceae bacterium]